MSSSITNPPFNHISAILLALQLPLEPEQTLRKTMDTQFLVFLACCIYPFSVFCTSDSSEEYRDEEIYRPKFGTEIKWIDQGQLAKTYKGISEPAGYEETYLCRAYHSKTWVPGKLIGSSCYITKNRVQHRFEEYQVPKIPDHKRTRWVSLNENFERRHLPKNIIVGGNHWDSTAYICRGLFGGILGSRVIVPGSYHPTENICYLEHNGAQVAWKGDTEVLVLDDKVNTLSTLVAETKNVNNTSLVLLF